jgi:hypothetical protein
MVLGHKVNAMCQFVFDQVVNTGPVNKLADDAFGAIAQYEQRVFFSKQLSIRL